MKKLLYIAVAVLSVACTADFEEQIVAVADTSVNTKIINSSTGCVEGSIVVRFNTSAESRLAECATRSGATRTGISGVDLVLDEVRGYAVKPVFVVTDRNRERVHAAGLHLWYELLFDEESDVDAVAAKLADVA
ncbi:MAG: peptidase S8, partial [Rikenellaceae bacterium]|nr:peptidase S8 [Rikenellaceae bacterium]